MVGGCSRRFRSFRSGGAAERLNAVEQVIATHLVFQHIDYMAAVDLDSVRMEIARLEAKGILRPEQAKGVDARQVAGFFASPAGELMRSGDRVLREFKFSLLCPASDYFSGGGADEVLLQGVIDCAVEKDGVWTIIDYKTDNVRTQAEIDARAVHYASQLRVYAMALRRIFGMEVAECLLYFLSAGKMLKITEKDLQS
jgi:ATP-dependent helicase/nuclease subunit A